MDSSDPATPRLLREPRTVRADRAFAWYTEALRLYRRHPLGFSGLAVAVFAVQLVLEAIPVIGKPASNVVVPLIACSLLYAALAVDRGDRPRLVHVVAPFAAPVSAIAAVISASLVVSAVEWLVAWHLAGVNLLATSDMALLSGVTVSSILAAGVAVSLPLALVPQLALFEQASVRDAFAGSMAAFFRNVPAFILYGALSVALLGVAFITPGGIGLAVALPLWAASSYVAWKHLFGIDG